MTLEGQRSRSYQGCIVYQGAAWDILLDILSDKKETDK